MLLLLLSAIVCSATAELPSFITPCHTADSASLLSSAKKAQPSLVAGVPALGMNTLDPLKVPHVSTNQAGLQLDMKDTTVKGLKNCEILSLRRHGNSWNLEVKCSVTLTGDYKMDGKLLVLPIQGDGKYKIKIRDILVKVQYDVEELERGGERYWHIAKWKHSTDVLTGMHYQFQNLFNGNKQASDAIHEFANSKWKEIYQEVAPPVFKSIVGSIIKEIEKLFDKVPIRELSLD